VSEGSGLCKVVYCMGLDEIACFSEAFIMKTLYHSVITNSEELERFWKKANLI
jgi:hypothetical protein